MSTHEEAARALVARWEHGDEAHRQWLRDIATPDISAALAAAEQRGAERAGKAVDALDALMRRLDSHFGGDPAQDWKEQEDARAVLALAKEQP